MAQRGLQGHAKQLRRLKRVVKRQRTILGIVMREVQRKLDADQQAIAAGGASAHQAKSPSAVADLMMWLERAERIRTQQRHDKNKLYALHAQRSNASARARPARPTSLA